MLLRAVLPVLGSLALLAGCQSSGWIHDEGAGDPLVGSIQDIAGQRAIDEAALLAELVDADFVLLGESPDNLDHQRLEARLVEELAGRGKPLAAVALEMIDTDQQATLVERLADGGGGGGALDELGTALRWEQRGWRAYDSYRPILAAALTAEAEIVAAGLPRGTVTAIVARGMRALPRAFAERTGLHQPLPPLLAAELDHEIASAHCGALAADLVARMAEAERARTASLADRLAAVTGRGKGVLIAGAPQVRRGWGVPWYLDRLRPGARTVSVAFVEVDRVPEMATGGAAYDYVWLTPGPGPTQDPGCAVPDDTVDQLEARSAPAAMRRMRS